MADLERDNLLADLSAYLDGELDPLRRQAVERLLAEAPDARGRLAELREVHEQLYRLPRLRVPAELGARLQRQLEAGWPGAPERSPWSGRVLRLGVPLAAAAAAVLAVGLFLRYQSRPRLQAQPRVVTQRLESKRPGAETPSPSLPLAAAELKKAERIPAQAVEPAIERPVSLGYAVPGVAPQPTVPQEPAWVVVLQPRDEAEYAAIQEVLSSWSAQSRLDAGVLAAAPAAGGTGGESGDVKQKQPPAAPSVPALQPAEYVYQLSMPELDARLAQLLEVNPGAQVALQMGFPAGEATSVRLATQATATRDEALAAGPAKPAAVAARAAGRQEKTGNPPVPAGKGAGPRRAIIGDQRDAAARQERAHAQHQAVTAELETITLAEEAPASQPTTQAAGQTSGATTQPGPEQVELRVRLLPAAPAGTPASQPAPRAGGRGSG